MLTLEVLLHLAELVPVLVLQLHVLVDEVEVLLPQVEQLAPVLEVEELLPAREEARVDLEHGDRLPAVARVLPHVEAVAREREHLLLEDEVDGVGVVRQGGVPDGRDDGPEICHVGWLGGCCAGLCCAVVKDFSRRRGGGGGVRNENTAGCCRNSLWLLYIIAVVQTSQRCAALRWAAWRGTGVWPNQSAAINHVGGCSATSPEAQRGVKVSCHGTASLPPSHWDKALRADSAAH